MAHLMVCVIGNLEKGLRLLDLWAAIGVRGITFVNSLQYHDVPRDLLREDTPFFLNLQNIFRRSGTVQYILFAIAQEHELAEKIMNVSRDILDDRNKENAGFIFALPVEQVLGIEKE